MFGVCLPEHEPNNTIHSILQLCRRQHNETVRPSHHWDLSSLKLVSSLAGKFAPSEVELLTDPTDKIKSRLFAKVNSDRSRDLRCENLRFQMVQFLATSEDIFFRHKKPIRRLSKCLICEKVLRREDGQMIKCKGTNLTVEVDGSVLPKHDW